jgi:hypothetical protein
MQKPGNYGNKHNLPEHVREMTGLRNEVIAWTSLDPKHEGDIEYYACCQLSGRLLVIPCFWPFMIILSPFLCTECISESNRIKSQYWILTENELKIVSESHDQCPCVPGCFQSGNTVKSIPLENITDCGVQARGNGFGKRCAGDLPIIYVDTASAKDGHEAIAVALARQQWFIREILIRRDYVKQGQGAALLTHSTSAALAPVMATASAVMERGGDTTHRSAAERIDEITQLHTSGILTNEQYEKKKQEIIDSI